LDIVILALAAYKKSIGTIWILVAAVEGGDETAGIAARQKVALSARFKG